MIKVLNCLLIALAFLCYITPASADHTGPTIPHEEIYVNIGESPLVPGGKLISVVSVNGIFDKSKKYSTKATSSRDPKCFQVGYGFAPASEKLISSTFSFDSGCAFNNPGEWTFELWLGEREADKNDSSIIVKNFKFQAQRPGGLGIPSIRAVNKNVQLGTKPQIVLSNASSEYYYYFWWNGATTNFAHIERDAQSDTLTLTPGLEGSDQNTAGQKKLCMYVALKRDVQGVGLISQPFPWNLNCPDEGSGQSITFNFTVGAPPADQPGGDAAAPGQCHAILPSDTPTSQDGVAVWIKGARANAGVRADRKSGERNENLAEVKNTNSSGEAILPLGIGLPAGQYTAYVYYASDNSRVCERSFIVGSAPPPTTAPKNCTQREWSWVPGSSVFNDPQACPQSGGQSCDPKTGGPGNGGVLTAIGCVPYEPVAFAQGILSFVISMAGGIALVIMIYGAYEMVTSSGNPDTLKKGQERFTGAILGLLFIVFSVLLLKIIGVDILDIPFLN